MSFFSKLFGGSDHAPEPAEDPDDSILQSLRDGGLDLGVERELAFFLYFPDAGQANAAAADGRSAGFAVELHPSPDPEGEWLVLLRKRLLPSRDVIKRMRTDLEALASRHDGEFEGWDAADAD